MCTCPQLVNQFIPVRVVTLSASPLSNLRHASITRTESKVLLTSSISSAYLASEDLLLVLEDLVFTRQFGGVVQGCHGGGPC